MERNGERNSAGPMEEQPVLHHSSENLPRSDILRQVPSRSAATSYSIHSINRDIPFYANKSTYENGTSNKPFHEHNTRDPVRTRQLGQAQWTANPQKPTNDYEQLSYISRETVNQNRHFLPQENFRQQGCSNSVIGECQPPQAHFSSQLDQTQLTAADNTQSNYDHNDRWNGRHDWTHINGWRVRRDVDKSHFKKDSRSNISPSTETSRPKVTRPEADNSASSQGSQNDFNCNYDYRNTSFTPGGKIVHKQKYDCIIENSKNQSFRVHDPWNFSNKFEDLNREYRSTKEKPHVEILLTSNTTKYETS